MDQDPGAPVTFSDDFDSACSTPFVSAPSSPGRGPPSYTAGGFFYSAPASPIHFMLSSSSSFHDSSNMSSSNNGLEVCTGFEFEFTAKEPVVAVGSMTSADELFLNGQIRPMKLSSHLQHPQILSPLIDGEEYETEDNNNNNNNSNNNIRESENVGSRGRDMKYSDRSKSLRRRARSMSPLRTNDESFEWMEDFVEAAEVVKDEKLEQEGKCEVKVKNEDNETPASGASSRSSSVGRSSKRWVFLKEFLYRSKSEGRSSTSGSTNHKFWASLSFSPSRKNDKKSQDTIRSTKTSTTSTAASTTTVSGDGEGGKQGVRKAVNGVGMTGKRRMARSAHERHYTTNRAQAEELRRKTYLPYKQGLLGCLGFSSRSYGAMNGFARALNPVSSR